MLEDDYVDHAPINRCARVKAAASGGQVLVTKATFDLVKSRLNDGFGLRKLGGFRLRDLTEPELIHQLDTRTWPPTSPRSALPPSAPATCLCRSARSSGTTGSRRTSRHCSAAPGP